MNLKNLGRIFGLCLVAAATAMCAGDTVEEETQDVIDAQQRAAEIAEDNPQDTAAIRRAGEEVINEQREAARATRKELQERGLYTDTLRPTTTN